MNMQRLTRIVVAGLASSLLLAIGAQPAEASYRKRAMVVAKVLSYESTLKRRAGSELNITIVHKDGDAASLSEAKSWASAFGALQSTRVQGLQIRVRTTSNAADVTSNGTDVIVVCRGLGAEAAEIRTAARRNTILTVGSDRGLVTGGMTLGVFMQGSKPKIVVNLAAAKREHVKFGSNLLRLAEVLR